MPREIRTLGIVGGGVIGSGWAARALACGLDVVAWDPAPTGEQALRDAVANAWPALIRIGLAPGADPERLRFLSSAEAVAAEADFVQESAPERIELKRKLHAAMAEAAPAEVILGSSSSGLLPSEIQDGARHPERIVIGHPFNPVYLLPLVEVVGGKQTAPETIKAASAFYASLGMKPLHVRNEIDGYIADRLLEALWREALHLVADGIATTKEIDEAICFGAGIRWAFMGTCLTYHLAGGEGGMAHMLEQFGPALELPWTRLEAPKLTDTLFQRMVDGTREQAGGWPVKRIERWRDERIIRILQALEAADRDTGHPTYDPRPGST
ncbi:L-carnitine dehydrogenase [Inquilinus limosus]|uniref:L-carnitine dehydrogenase n=1 Tax=Inquilinus limosus TaxID=171674 RepID=UPI003F17D0BF